MLPICNISYFPFWFWGWIWVLIDPVPDDLCILFTSLPVTSGVPHGSVLGPILVYINDLPGEVCSQIRLFADHTALFLTLKSEDDGSTHQNDLVIMSLLETRWDNEFNPSKYQVLHVKGSKRPVKGDRPGISIRHAAHCICRVLVFASS